MKKLLFTLLSFLFLGNVLTAQGNNTLYITQQANQRITASYSGNDNYFSLCNLVPGQQYKVIISSQSEEGCNYRINLPASGQIPAVMIFFTAHSVCEGLTIMADCPTVKTKTFQLSVSKMERQDRNKPVEKEILSTILTSQNSDATDLVQNVFIGGDCFEVEGVTYNGASGQLGSFSNGLSSINIDQGVIISTGAIGNAAGPNNFPNATTGYFTSGFDSDLDAISGGGTLYDIAKIEFDFTPTEDQITFEYAFASDEYCEFAGTQYNDVFGFFISGPGINGPYSNNSDNIAIVPGTGDNVAINSVNHYTNIPYYLDNSITEACASGFPVAPNDIEFDGFTTVLTAIANVIPCETYHIKLIIGDRGDDIYDSAVFLKANSFGGEPEANVTSEISGNAASDIAGYEGCSDAVITFTRVGNDLSNPVIINYVLSNQSTATPGVDYEALPGSIVIPAGQVSVSISIEIYLDLIAEGMESIFIELQQACSCQASLVEIQIFDSPPLEVTLPDLEVCAGQPTTITPVVSGGIPPYTYAWSNGSTSESIEIQVDTPTSYSVSVSDDCHTAEATFFNVTPTTASATLSGNGQICGGNSSVTLSVDLTGIGPWDITYAVDGVPTTVNNINSSPYTFEGTVAGNYQLVSVVSAGGCPVQISGQASISENSYTANLSGGGEICGGSNSVALSIDLSGSGPWNITYAVNGAPTTVNNVTNSPYIFTGTESGTYSLISVESADGCPVDVSGQATVTEVVNTATLSGQGQVCGGSSSVDLSVALPGSGPWHVTYAVNGVQTTVFDVTTNPFIFQGTQAGTYNLVSVESADGCPIQVTGQSNITAFQINVSPTVEQVACFGESTGSIQLSAQGGTAPYLYDWGLGAFNQSTINNLPAGAYFITVYDSFGCAGEISVQISEPAELVAQPANVTDADCQNLGGSISLTASGGNGPYNYFWPGGVNSPNQSNLDPGDYTITVSDAAGCQTTVDATVADLIDYPVAVAQASIINCYSDISNVSAEGSTTDNVYYEWFAPNGASLSETGLNINVTNPGTYTLIVTNTINYCSTPIQVEVIADTQAPVVDAGTSDLLDCTTLSIWLEGSVDNASPAFLYQWFTPDGNILQGDDNPMTEVNAPGTYNFSVLNPQNGCIGEDNVLVMQDLDLPEVVIQNPPVLNCTDTEITLTSTGTMSGPGITYEWVTADGNIIGTNDNEELVLDQPGFYQLVVTNANNGCVNSMEVFVPIDTIAPVANAGEDMELDCLGTSLFLNGNGSSTGANYTYQWSTLNGALISGQQSLSPETDAAGTYTLLVTNTENGCTATDQNQVFNSNGALTLSAEVNDILNCYHSTVQVSGSITELNSNYSALWTSPAGNPIVNPGNLNIQVSSPGIYLLQVVNTDNGCVSNAGIEVFQDIQAPLADAGPDQIVSCFNPSVTLDASNADSGPGFSIQWINPDGSTPANSNGIFLETALSGVFTLEVLNLENGCLSTDQVVVNPDFAQPTALAGQNMVLNCAVNSVELNGLATAGGDEFEFEWIDNQTNTILSNTSLDYVIEAPGIYILSVLNTENGCAASDSIEVVLDIIPPVAAAAVDGVLNCINANVNLLGTTSSQGPEISYQWTYLDQHTNIATAASAAVDLPGNYQLVVTDTDNHCVDTAFVQVAQDLEMPIATLAQPEEITCEQLLVSLNGTGSSVGSQFQYTWTLPDGSTSSQGTGPNFTASNVGIFTLEVLNTINGCSASSSVEVISQDELPTAEAGPTQLINCYVSEVTLNPSGSSTGGSYSYQWQQQGGGQISQSTALQSITVNVPGIYEFVVTDTSTGCASADAVVVNINVTPPAANAGPEMTLTCEETTLSLNGSQSSMGNMSYQWSTTNGVIISGQNLPEPLISAPGIYNLSVTNLNNGCQASDQVVVAIDTIHPEIGILPANLLTCAVTSVTLQGTSNGAYNYQWLNGNNQPLGTGNSIAVQTPGSYQFVATDMNNGCQSATFVEVDQNITPPVADAGGGGTLTCATTSLELNGSLSSANSSYQWMTNGGFIQSGGTGLTPVVTLPGTYIIHVTDNFNGCDAWDEVTISQDIEIPIAVAANNGLLTCTNTSVTLLGTSNPGIPLEYEWQYANGQTFVTGSPNTTVTAPGTYQFYVYNPDNGCDNSATVAVQQDIALPVAEAGVADDLTCLVTSLALEGSVLSGGGNYSYGWSGPTGGIIANMNTPNPIVQMPGIYTLLVTNVQNGCTDTDEVEVDLIAPTGIELTLQQPLCHGDPAFLEIETIEGGAEPYVYSINGGSSFVQNSNFTLLSPGWHLVVVQDANGCEFAQGVQVEDVPVLTIELEPLATIKLGESYQINATVNFPVNQLSSISWAPAESLSCDDCLNPLAAPFRTTDYHLEVVNENGCRDDAWLRLIVDERPNIYIPNVFSPNEDGTNEIFHIYAKENTIKIINSLQIYTRWGELVFEVYDFPPNDPQYGWDGFFRGVPMNSGVFVYWTEVELINGQPIILKGDVTIIR